MAWHRASTKRLSAVTTRFAPRRAIHSIARGRAKKRRKLPCIPGRLERVTTAPAPRNHSSLPSILDASRGSYVPQHLAIGATRFNPCHPPHEG